MNLLLSAVFARVCSSSGTCSKDESASSCGVSLLQSALRRSRLGKSDGDGGSESAESDVAHAALEFPNFLVSRKGIRTYGGGEDNDAPEASQVEGGHAIEPIYYLHVPKCGSSFATAVAHLACGDKIDRESTVDEPGNPVDHLATQKWNKKCGDGRFARFESGHEPLDPTMSDESLSKVVMMVREPNARISSGYMHNLHDCFPLQKKYNIKHQDAQPWQPDGELDPSILEEYARCVHSCMTNMLIGHSCAYYRGEPSEEQQSLDREAALARLPKLGFVGLTDQWDLSVCLWHAKFGGECLPAEFRNVRPARTQYSAADLSESSHVNDRAIYDRAAELFAADLAAHGVTPEACARTYCPEVAHLFGGSSLLQQEGVACSGACSGSSALPMKYTPDLLKTLTWPGRMFYDED